MAKTGKIPRPKVKLKAKRKKRGQYDEPLEVKGSFLDIVKSAVKDAENKTKEK